MHMSIVVTMKVNETGYFITIHDVCLEKKTIPGRGRGVGLSTNQPYLRVFYVVSLEMTPFLIVRPFSRCEPSAKFLATVEFFQHYKFGQQQPLKTKIVLYVILRTYCNVMNAIFFRGHCCHDL